MKKNLFLGGVACLILFVTGCATSQNPVSQAESTTTPTRNPNLIQNGDFNNSLEHWSTIGQGTNPYHPGDPGQAAFKIEDGLLGIEIQNQGVSIWSVMLYQSVLFEKGAAYDISFDAKSDSEIQIISNVSQDGTWANFSGDKRFKLTNVMSSYSYQFTMSEDGAALFQLCLGTAGTGKVYFDNIVIRKKS